MGTTTLVTTANAATTTSRTTAPAARITASMGAADTTSTRAGGRMKTAVAPSTATGPRGTLSLESSPILARRLAESGVEVDDYEARKAALVGSK
jgi:hypothetical protein